MPTSSWSCAQHQKASCGVPTAHQFGAGGPGVRPSTSGPVPAPCPPPRAALQHPGWGGRGARRIRWAASNPPPRDSVFGSLRAKRIKRASAGRGVGDGAPRRCQAPLLPPGQAPAAAKRRRFPPPATHPARPASHTGLSPPPPPDRPSPPPADPAPGFPSRGRAGAGGPRRAQTKAAVVGCGVPRPGRSTAGGPGPGRGPGSGSGPHPPPPPPPAAPPVTSVATSAAGGCGGPRGR